MEVELIDEFEVENALSIPFVCVIFGDRARSSYNRIEELGQSILDNGLIQPLVLVPLEGKTVEFTGIQLPAYGLDAGGRRYTALKRLMDEGKIAPFLYHATTCDPTRPGFVLKG